jgi:hypothetical protein
MSLHISTIEMANSNTFNTSFLQPFAEVHQAIFAAGAVGLLYVSGDDDLAV